MELRCIFYESCPACPAEMRVREYTAEEPKTVVRVEDCPSCDHQDSFKVLVEE